MTKAPKNLHENLAAITFLMENTSSAHLDKGRGMGCLTWGQQEEKRGLLQDLLVRGRPRNKPVINANVLKRNKESMSLNA